MRNTAGAYMIITIVLGCLTHLFTFTLGYSTVPSLRREEQLNHTSSSVQLTPLVQVQVPVVIMTMPAVVGACDNLLIDLSASWGHLGQPWTTVAWTVTSVNSTDTNDSSSNNRLADRVVDYLTKYFDPINTARVSLPSSLWQESVDVVLSLTASLTNYLQQSSSDTRVVIIRSRRDSSGSSGNDLLATRYSIRYTITLIRSSSYQHTHPLFLLLIDIGGMAPMKWH